MSGAYSGRQGLTVAHRGCVQWHTGDGRVYWGCVQGRTGDDRVYRGSVQWHTGDVQGVTVKTQGVTGEDRGFSYGQGFLKSVVSEVFVLG